MDIMAGMSSNAFFIALVQIVAIDIVLGGDNAIIIALACRNLPKNKNALAFCGERQGPSLYVLFSSFLPALL